VFSTAEDNQPAVTIKIGQGERELFQYNKLLGEFNLEGIAAARRGTPQIEVTLDIDANGIMHVSAKDNGTGKENKITIKSSSGLSEEEIERMVKDAEVNAESDKKQRELIEARNMAEGQLHTLKSDYFEVENELSEEDKTLFNEQVKNVEELLKSDDKDKITESVTELFTKAKPIFDIKQKKTADAKDDIVDAEVKETV
jgi:molecular chaperone DnaK